MILEKSLYDKFGPLRGSWSVFRTVANFMFKVIINNSFLKKKVSKLIEQTGGSRRRGIPYLVLSTNEKILCDSCGDCVDVCPTDCIDLKDRGSGKEPRVFDINSLKCIYCGYCEDICPQDAIKMSHRAAFPYHHEKNPIWDKKFLAQHNVLNDSNDI